MLHEFNLFELAVIYLAFGAPVGVYHLVTHWARSPVPTLSTAAVNTFLWPLAALVFLYGRLGGTLGLPPERADEIASDLNRVAETVLPTGEFFIFRDAVATYVGLSQALERPVGTSAVEALAEFHPSAGFPASKACWTRRNESRLYRHQGQARATFLREMYAAAVREPSMVPIARRLAASLNDHIAVTELASVNLSDEPRIHSSSDRLSIAA